MTTPIHCGKPMTHWSARGNNWRGGHRCTLCGHAIEDEPVACAERDDIRADDPEVFREIWGDE